MAELAYTARVSIVSCCTCGCPIALANEDELRRTHAGFTCPNGHSQAFKADSEAERLKKELEREKQRREMAERGAAMEAKRADKAERGIERLKKRAAAGLCPCCNRNFQNLQRHMATKHPDVKPT